MKSARKGAIKVQKADIRQFLRFCIVGTSNAVIDFGVLNLLLWLYPTTDGWKILEYNSLAVLLAATNSFFWNKYWTFRQRNPITFQEVSRFIVVAGGTTLINDTLMWLLGRAFPEIVGSNLVGANILKLGAIIGTMSVSFFGMRLWVFFQHRRGKEVRSLADYETERLPALKLFYDLDTSVTYALSKPGSSADKSSLRRLYSLKTLIIIPTYNEFENLPLLLKEIFSFAPETQVLIVDDNSPDGTGKLAEEICSQNPRVHVLHRPGKLGPGTAYIAGFKYAIQHGYDAAFEMDADFSHDPRSLPDFLKAIEHADLVIGSRYIPGGKTPNWSLMRRLVSGSGNVFARFVLGIPVHDCTGGFRCYRREVLQSLDLDAIQSRGYAFQVELTYRVLNKGFKIVETPITFMDRRLGTSKMSRKIVLEALSYVLRTRFKEGSVSGKRVTLHRSGESARPAVQEQENMEEPVSFPAVQAPRPSVRAPALPLAPFPALKSVEPQVHRLRRIKLAPLWEPESALEP